MKQVTVLLIEESPLFQLALSSMLRDLGFSVILHSSVPAKVVKRPQVILIDAATLGENPQELHTLVRTYSATAPILLLAREDRIEQVVVGLKAGAVGFCKQTASPRDLRKGIIATAEGGTWCDTGLLRKITQYLPEVPYPQTLRFTKREREVLSRVAVGQSNKEIAQQLGVTVQSIKVYVSNLFRKTGASNRSTLVSLAVIRGLTQAP